MLSTLIWCPRHLNNGRIYPLVAVTMKIFNKFTATILPVREMYIFIPLLAPMHNYRACICTIGTSCRKKTKQLQKHLYLGLQLYDRAQKLFQWLFLGKLRTAIFNYLMYFSVLIRFFLILTKRAYFSDQYFPLGIPSFENNSGFSYSRLFLVVFDTFQDKKLWKNNYEK